MIKLGIIGNFSAIIIEIYTADTEIIHVNENIRTK